MSNDKCTSGAHVHHCAVSVVMISLIQGAGKATELLAQFWQGDAVLAVRAASALFILAQHLLHAVH